MVSAGAFKLIVEVRIVSMRVAGSVLSANGRPCALPALAAGRLALRCGGRGGARGRALGTPRGGGGAFCRRGGGRGAGGAATRGDATGRAGAHLSGQPSTQ